MPRELPTTPDVVSEEPALTRQPDRASQIQPASRARLSTPKFRAPKSHTTGDAAEPRIPPLAGQNPPRKVEQTPAHESGIKWTRAINSPERQLPPKEAAKVLGVSESWLAKARMRGDGPAFSKFGRSVRYGEGDLLQYVKSRRRLSTSER